MTNTPTAELALIGALRQAGVNLKRIFVTTGYDPSVLHSGVNLEGMSVPVAFAPFELNLPAQKIFNDAIAKYAHGAPNQLFGMYGYLSAGLVPRGIQDAGSCPTRKGVLDAITNLRGYTADGLIPPTSYDLASRAQVLKCDYFVTIHDDKFVIDNNGKPFCVKGPNFAVNYSKS
jgi:branched-chain amino acid transport system substrate-binding protein